MANKSNNSGNRRPNIPVYTGGKNKGFYPQAPTKQAFGKKRRREDGKIKY